MTDAEFAAVMAAAAPYLDGQQRILVSRFVATLIDRRGPEIAKAHRSRREQERLWEERQLDAAGNGVELERRRREP